MLSRNRETVLQADAHKCVLAFSISGSFFISRRARQNAGHRNSLIQTYILILFQDTVALSAHKMNEFNKIMEYNNTMMVILHPFILSIF